MEMERKEIRKLNEEMNKFEEYNRVQKKMAYKLHKYPNGRITETGGE